MFELQLNYRYFWKWKRKRKRKKKRKKENLIIHQVYLFIYLNVILFLKFFCIGFRFVFLWQFIFSILKNEQAIHQHLRFISFDHSLSVFKNPKPKSSSLSLWLKRELGIGNWGMELEVRLVGGIENCFVSLPLPLVQTLDSSSAHLLTLELRSRTGHRWFVAWSGATSTSSSSAIEVLLIFSHNN